MESIIITPAREEDISLIKRLLERMNARFRVLSEDEKEDIGLLNLMSEGDPNDTVSEEEIIKVLRRP